jgi:Rha family phage regulatory protein
VSKLILNPEYRLYERNGKAFCSSRQVAEEFGKRHADVLRAIEKITAPTSGVSAEFTALNFEGSKFNMKGGRP